MIKYEESNSFTLLIIFRKYENETLFNKLELNIVKYESWFNKLELKCC